MALKGTGLFNTLCGMRHLLLVTSFAIGLSGCAQLRPQAEVAPEVSAADTQPEVAVIRPQARPSGLNAKVKAPPKSARTVDQFDTTSAAEKVEAAKAAADPVAKSNRLGVTIASLGSPADPGFWLETPLVDVITPGRVVYPANGKAVVVELRPIAGPKTAGSRMSLPAMRVIEAPLTGLPEVEVFATN